MQWFFSMKAIAQIKFIIPNGVWAWRMGGNTEWCWDWDEEGCVQKSEQTRGVRFFKKGCWGLNRLQNNFHPSKTSCFSLGEQLLQLMPLSFLSCLVEKWAYFFSLKQKFVKYQLSLATRNSFLSLWLILDRRWGGWKNLIFLFTQRWFDISFYTWFQWHMIRCPSLLCSSLFLVYNFAFVTWYWHDFWL